MKNSVNVPLVKMVGITKKFGSVIALENVDFEVFPNEIVALVGDNGAGKSTLVRILCGIYRATKGEIFFKDKKVTISSPKVAEELGIEAVHQGFGLIDTTSVVRNIFVGRELATFWPFLGFLDMKKMKQKTNEIIQTIGTNSQINADSGVTFLSGGERQSIKIGRAMFFKSKIVILDEPTMALSVRERHNVLEIIKNLKTRGISAIFISHDIHVVYNVCDRIVILEKGIKIGDFLKKETDADIITRIIRSEQK
jgi:ABC-type sugar transport system ATPase subunit